MSAGNRLPQPPSPQSQPGQRALRLVAAAAETIPTSSAQSTRTPTPSPTLRRLQRDLEAARAEALSLHDLLEQLPGILERKFQLRLNALLAEQHQLQHDNALLQHHLLALHSGAELRLEPSALPLALDSPAGTSAAERPITQGLGLRRALRHVHLPGR